MSYDPIQRAIDIQLSGILNDFRPHNPENLLVRAYDLKYHPEECREDLITCLAVEKYTQCEIGNLTGLRQGTISKILRVKLKQGIICH